MHTLLIVMFIIGGIILLALLGIAAFFFIVTRGALLFRAAIGAPVAQSSHVYPVYSKMWLIKLVDFQPLISALLLFQYEHIVDRIVTEIERTMLGGKRALITSCAFGNVVPRVVHALGQSGAQRIVITDIIQNELARAKGKLSDVVVHVDFSQENATKMKQASGSVDVNVMFFLLHELPHHLQEEALREAGRVIAKGGKLILAEFHRPDTVIMRFLSRIYFYVFEPYGLALWNSHDPVLCLERSGAWACERKTYFFGNFQVIVATKG